MREDLQDYGIIIDTLESAVTWDNLHRLHQGVREFVKSRPGTICMTHASHFYPQGTNLYFIYIMKMDDTKAYLKFQKGVIDAITKNGGSPSHHHGTAPTRELALQVEESFRCYGRYLPLRTAVILGGVSSSLQIKALQKKTQTPRGHSRPSARPLWARDLSASTALKCWCSMKPTVCWTWDSFPISGGIVAKLPVISADHAFLGYHFYREIAELASGMLKNLR